jgi:hypothetical protein
MVIQTIEGQVEGGLYTPSFLEYSPEKESFFCIAMNRRHHIAQYQSHNTYTHHKKGRYLVDTVLESPQNPL